jgi:hypothetical protein
MNIEHCSQNFKNYCQKISLFSYIQFFGLMALMPLKPSTSLTPHYAVPPSLSSNTRSLLCHCTTHSVAMSTRIPHYLLAVSLWDSSLAICWTLAVSLWEDSLTIPWMLAVSPWGHSIAIHCSLAVSLWGHCLCASECWYYIELSHFSILPHSSRQCYLSLSLKSMRRIWWSVPLTRRHWHSGSCDVRGFTGCILLGAAASLCSGFGK